jgi:hypothetical protein
MTRWEIGTLAVLGVIALGTVGAMHNLANLGQVLETLAAKLEAIDERRPLWTRKPSVPEHAPPMSRSVT